MELQETRLPLPPPTASEGITIQPPTKESPNVPDGQPLATRLEDDPEFIRMRNEQITTFKENRKNSTPDENVDDIDEKYQDFQHGRANADDPRGRVSLDQRVKDEFQQKFPDRAKAYEDRVFPDVHDDPVVVRIRSDLVTATNREVGTNIRDWDRANNRLSIARWNAFVDRYPEKAKAYAERDNDPEIKAALERQARRKEREAAEDKQPQPDARDFFSTTAFQKEAATNDPDPAHPWDKVSEHPFAIEDDVGTIAAGELQLPEKGEENTESDGKGLLIADHLKDGQTESLLVENLNTSRRGKVLEALQQVTTRLSEKHRHLFVQALMYLLQDRSVMQGTDAVFSESLSVLPLMILDNHPKAVEHETGDASWYEGLQNPPNDTQQQEINEFLTWVSRNVSKDRFDEIKTELHDHLQQHEQALSSDYDGIFSLLRDKVLDTPDTQTPKNLGAQKNYMPKEFDVSSEIYPVTSAAEVTSRLGEQPTETPPSVVGKKLEEEHAEFVLMADVITDDGMRDPSKAAHIYEIAKGIQDKAISVTRPPLRVIESNGKYIADGEKAAERIAALKVLGVKKVPMMVRRAQS